MYGITNDEILDQFFHGLEPIIGPKILEENLQTIEKACILTERILELENLVGEGGKCNK